ncbi:MAG TPA: tetratricopeptide repeat protein, partial [Quisquiliibacterium sp.]|nr:tetratricopeptide repeat protein [Quisquiliibacterium sp.]
MSVINLMLQDLDERRAQPTAAALPAGLAPVAPPSAWRRRLPVALASVTVLMSAVAGAHYWTRHDANDAGADRGAAVVPRGTATPSHSVQGVMASAATATATPAGTPEAAAVSRPAAVPTPVAVSTPAAVPMPAARSTPAAAATSPSAPATGTRTVMPPVTTARASAADDGHAAVERDPASSRLRLFDAAPQAHSVSERRLPAPAAPAKDTSSAQTAPAQTVTTTPAQTVSTAPAQAAATAPAQAVAVAPAQSVAPATASLPSPRTAAAQTPDPAPGPVSIERHSRAPTLLTRAETAYRAAIGRYNAGDLEGAVQGLRTVLADDATHAAARQALAAMLIDRREWDAALLVLEEGLRAEPRHAQFAQLAAQIAIRRDDLQ